jgi:hypothetical protein
LLQFRQDVGRVVVVVVVVVVESESEEKEGREEDEGWMINAIGVSRVKRGAVTANTKISAVETTLAR